MQEHAAFFDSFRARILIAIGIAGAVALGIVFLFANFPDLTVAKPYIDTLFASIVAWLGVFVGESLQQARETKPDVPILPSPPAA